MLSYVLTGLVILTPDAAGFKYVLPVVLVQKCFKSGHSAMQHVVFLMTRADYRSGKTNVAGQNILFNKRSIPVCEIQTFV